MLKSLSVAAALAMTAGVAFADGHGDHGHGHGLEGPVYEIAIQEVKEGQEEAWVERRGALLDALEGREGNEKDWTFPAFFTFPEPGPLPVYIGVTRWSSLEDFGAAAEELMPTQMAADFFETVNLQAFVQVAPADGKSFVLEDYINTEGQVLEVAVRQPKEGMEDQFDSLRKGFFDRVAAQPGYIFDREFISADGKKVVMIGWETQADFMTALGVLSQFPEMGAFFGAIDGEAYQASLVPAQ